MLKTNTTSPELLSVLMAIMALPELADFRLVGGTALSLLRGHRISIDIDLFTNKQYGTNQFDLIEERIRTIYPYVINIDVTAAPALKKMQNNYGLHLFIGTSEEERIKTDILYWNAPFIFEPIEKQGIRLASTEEIAIMKLDTISRGGRKKDFWDLFDILETYNLQYLLDLYTQKYPYHNIDDVIVGLTNFTEADDMPDPICLKGRHWELIREEFKSELYKLSQQ